MEQLKKISMLEELNCNRILRIEKFYDILEKCDMIKCNYTEYLTTKPIDCNAELQRVASANYDTCCALLTMLLREDYFSNGSFEKRQRAGQVKSIVDRLIYILSTDNSKTLKQFSEKTLKELNGYYVYALIDPRSETVFYIGKGTDNRVFSHEAESGKFPKSEKRKIQKIQEIEQAGFQVKRLIVNWGLTESEAFAAEASLINLMNFISKNTLANLVSGHHVHESFTAEEFELLHGAEILTQKDIQHNILVIKINKLYRKDMSPDELYDITRGMWRASLNSIQKRNVEYVFAVYNQLIVAVYKPDEWHYVYENIDLPQHDNITPDVFEKLKNRIYFICKDYENLDKQGQFYLHKSIAELKVNQSAQNPITYLSPSNT